MRCISVYTNNFDTFSEIFEQVIAAELKEDEETEISGVTVSVAGEPPQHYLERMRRKPGVVVMRDKDRNITILQHRDLFEVFLPAAGEEMAVH